MIMAAEKDRKLCNLLAELAKQPKSEGFYRLESLAFCAEKRELVENI